MMGKTQDSGINRKCTFYCTSADNPTVQVIINNHNFFTTNSLLFCLD